MIDGLTGTGTPDDSDVRPFLKVPMLVLCSKFRLFFIWIWVVLGCIFALP